MNRTRIKSDDNVDINKIIGTNLRFIRQLAGKTQTRLSKELSITFQQVQKYEGGRNGMSAYRLYKAAKYLNVPMEAFFDAEYIAKMRAVHEAKYFNNGGVKPKDFFNVYSYQKDSAEDLATVLYQDRIKGKSLTPQEEQWLERFDNGEDC